jgi:hypothetical protein
LRVELAFLKAGMKPHRFQLFRLARLFVALALAGSIGLHWAVLQTLAWAGMFISYSQAAPLTQAVVKTFDGQHPCNLCKQIAQGKRSESKTTYSFEVKKLEYSCAKAVFIFQAPLTFWEIESRNIAAESRAHAPPAPPPKNLLG